jgi:hypothetical protein
VAKPKGTEQTPESPQDFAQVTPRDLYPTSDIRFVMMELGKLGANVERLIADVRSQGEKVDAMRQQASYIKGMIAAAVVLVGVFIWLASMFLSEKWDAAVAVLKVLAK